MLNKSTEPLWIFFALDLRQKILLIRGIHFPPDPNLTIFLMDISSLIVCARPEHSQQLRANLEALDGVEVHTVAEDGRMIITIEAPTEKDTVNMYEVINRLPNVMSVSMVYHQVESDPDEEA